MVPLNLRVLPQICSIQFATSLIVTLPCCLLTPLSQSLTQDIFFLMITCSTFPCFFCFPFSNTSQLQQTLHFWTVSALPLLPCFRDFSWVLSLTICWFLTLVSPLLTYLLFSFPCFLKNAICFFSCMTSLSQTSAVYLIVRGWTPVLFWLSYFHKVRRLDQSVDSAFSLSRLSFWQ